jgi:ATP synthase subunit 6
LNNLYFTGLSLKFNSLKEKFTASNILYFFSTQENYMKSFIPNFNIYVFENVYNVILGMVKENIGGNVQRAVRFFPFIFSLFVFILIANLIGLIPYSSTVTSYLIVTFAMAIMVLLGVNIIAGRFHGVVYFGHFLPAGCPFALYPLIIPIEFISYVFRVVSLSVRLFANMMAGHTLLAVLAGFGWTMANADITLFVIHPLPVLVVFVLVFLETAVAIIQAYVFTILTCMYLDEAINLH